MAAPWRPADIEQLEGRIIRQGNQNEYVKIFRYVTEGSFDAYMWQTLETKSRLNELRKLYDELAEVTEPERPDTVGRF